MPTDDYSTAVSGGLKIKGVNPSSKVTKHKKKKPKPEINPGDHETPCNEAVTRSQERGVEGAITEGALAQQQQQYGETPEEREKEAELQLTPPVGKTEAELRHQERRRKRLDERLKREGTKTHKERVEELNRYLSNLSEHHDMPRIGPG